MDLSALQTVKNLDMQHVFMFFQYVEDMAFLIRVENVHTFRVLNVNKAYLKTTGIDLASIQNKDIEELLPAQEKELTLSHYQQAIAQKQMLIYEEQSTLGGKARTYETTLVPIFANEQETCEYILGISRNIDQRKDHEKALQYVNRELTNMMRNQQGLMFKVQKWHDNFYYTLCDGKLVYDLGFTPHDIVGRKIQDLFPTEKATFLIENYKRCWDMQEQIIFEMHNIKHFSWLTSLSPIVEEGETIALIGSSIDIKEKKETEEALAQAEKLALLGELAAGIGHEIRNPLTVIKGFISLMLQDDSFLTPKFIKLIETEIDYINQTAGELMMLAKPQAQQILPLNVQALLNEVATLLDSAAFMNRVTIQTDYVQEAALMHGDRHQLKKAFFNLLKNAIEAMSEKKGGRVLITCKKENNYILITIEDEGMGISTDQLQSIGEPFYTTKKKGNGLGLMVTYRVVRNHGGTITCESEIGIGTKFSISFPAQVN